MDWDDDDKPLLARPVQAIHVLPIAIGDRPFAQPAQMRPVWRCIFQNQKCLTQNRSLVRDGWWPGSLSPELKRFLFPLPLWPRYLPSSLSTLVRDHRWSSRLPSDVTTFYKDALPELFPSIPFVRNLGAVCLNLGTLHLADNTDRAILANFFAGGDEPQDLLDMIKVFGYDRKIEDERMNFVCFEPYEPVRLRLITHDGVWINGKVRVHLYACGYIILRMEFSIDAKSLKKLSWTDGIKRLQQLLLETKPSNRKSTTIWRSRLGNKRLSELVKQVKESLRESLFNDSSHFREGQWQTVISVFHRYNGRRFAADLLSVGRYESMDIADNYGSPKLLLSSRKGSGCTFVPEQGRKSARSFFLKYAALVEFVVLKQMIYGDYAHFLREQIGELVDFRLSLRRKLTKEDLLKFSVYDTNVHRFMAVLDRHIIATRPFYRRIYSHISVGTGFGERREKVKALVNEWHDEVAKWEPGLLKLWTKVIRPLSKALTGGPNLKK